MRCADRSSTRRPPTLTEQPVTDEDLAAAERSKDRAAEEERVASEAARAARAAHADAAARAGGEGVTALEAAHVAAETAVATAQRGRRCP